MRDTKPSAPKKRRGKPFTPFVKNFENLRTLLRWVSFGCFTTRDFERLGIDDRTYGYLLQRIGVFIPEEHVKHGLHDRNKRVTFSGDIYRNAENYLIHIYRARSFDRNPDRLFCLLAILQYLAAAARPLPVRTLMDGAPPCAGEGPTADSPVAGKDEQTVRNYLAALCALGLVHKVHPAGPKGRFADYQIAPNPLDDLTDREVRALLFAVSFYRDVSPLGVPGYDLADTISRCYPDIAAAFRSPWQVKNNAPARILDDAVVYTILSAIEAGDDLSFAYGDTSPTVRTSPDKNAVYTVRPHSLVARRADRRLYLIGDESKNRTTRRVDDMTHVRAVPRPSRPEEKHPRHRTKRQAAQDDQACIRLRLYCADDAEYRRTIGTIRSRYPDITVEETADPSRVVQFSAQDPLAAVPFLRTLHPRCEVLAPQNIRDRIRNDLKEALKNYGEG